MIKSEVADLGKPVFGIEIFCEKPKPEPPSMIGTLQCTRENCNFGQRWSFQRHTSQSTTNFEGEIDNTTAQAERERRLLNAQLKVA